MSSGTVSIMALKDNDYYATEFPGTTAGLQAAIDYLVGGKGEVYLGPGTLLTTTAIWLHSYCHLRGSGIGVTIINRSTMANGDASNSGPVLCTSPYGSNGTVNTSSTTGSDITVCDMTLDGNYSSFGSVTQANLLPNGLETKYIDGVRVTRVRVQNTLADGFRHENCRNVYLTDVETNTTGQWSVVAARNAINFIGDGASSGSWGYNYNLKGASLVTTGDEAMQVSNINLLTIDNVLVDGCDFVFECSPAGGTTAGTFDDWSISNIVAQNVLDYFITFAAGQGTGYTLNDVAFDNCHFKGHATLHNGGAIALPATASFVVNGLSISNCTFRNINTTDTTTHHWFDSQPADAAGVVGLQISNCQFYGKNGSVRTGAEIGINIRGSHKNVHISDVLLKDMAGTAVRLNDTTVYAATVQRDIKFSNVTVDTCNDFAYRITVAAASTTASFTEIEFNNCTAKDASTVTAGAGIQLFSSQAGGSISSIKFRGCRAYKTSGTNMTHGLGFSQSAGTVSGIEIDDCDFSGCQTNWMTSSGTVSNVYFAHRTGKGTAIASAATIAIPQDGSTFHVTGTTNITNGVTVNPWDNGRTVTLIFDDILTMSDTGTSVLSVAYITTANDTLTLSCDGTNWYEVARSAN